MSSSAGQPTKVGRISTRIAPSSGATVDAMDDPEVDDREHRQLRVRDLGEGGADGRLVDARRGRRGADDRPGPGARDADLGPGLAHQVAPGSRAADRS